MSSKSSIGAALLLVLAAILTGCALQGSVVDSSQNATPSVMNAVVNLSNSTANSPPFSVHNATNESPVLLINATSNATPERVNNTLSAAGNMAELFISWKGGPYVRLLIREGEARTYSFAGDRVIVEPVIIAREGAIFKVGNVTSRALEQRESQRTALFDLYVHRLYTKG